MLVLTRKMNESIIIDGGIEVMVVAVHGNKVRLGFRAPADVAIQRTERVTRSFEFRPQPFRLLLAKRERAPLLPVFISQPVEIRLFYLYGPPGG